MVMVVVLVARGRRRCLSFPCGVSAAVGGAESLVDGVAEANGRESKTYIQRREKINFLIVD